MRPFENPLPEPLMGIEKRIASFSGKVAALFRESVQEVTPLLEENAALPWGEVCEVVAEASATAAMKYLRESPGILQSVGRSRGIREALMVVLGVARDDYGVALEVFRQYPRILPALGPEAIRPWAQIGLNLAREDYDAAIEYVKSGPEILPLLLLQDLESWARLGLLIFRKDRVSKAFRGVEYFRLGPQALQRIAGRAARGEVLELCASMEEGSTAPAMDLLDKAGRALSLLTSPQDQEAVLSSARAMAGEFPAVVLPYLRSIPEALRLCGGSVSTFQDWVNQGIQFSRKDPEKGKAFFTLEFKASRELLEKLSRGVSLKDISRTLKFYAEGLCGRPVEIHSKPVSQTHPISMEGRIILPEIIEVFPGREDNFRLYRVMTLHEAGHLEFGTYQTLSSDAAADLPDFQNQVLAHMLWTLVEEGRIDFLLRDAYPGIREDMDFVLTHQLRHRPDLFRLPRHQGILESLMRLSVTESVEVPLPLLDVVSGAYDILKGVLRRGASLADAVKTTKDLYRYLEGPLGMIQWESLPPEGEKEKAGQPTLPHGSPSPFSWRGPLPGMAMFVLQENRSPDVEIQPNPPRLRMSVEALVVQGVEVVQERNTVIVPHSGAMEKEGKGLFFYDEWDIALRDYRRRWCRIEEKEVAKETGTDVQGWVGRHAGELTALRRYFEAFRPEAFRKVKHQEDGDEIDVDAVITAYVERKKGGVFSDRIYQRKEKNCREISTAFLIDLSGSTRRLVAPGETESAAESTVSRVIDIEKEGLLLLSEALQAVGDEYALFGFSGQSKDQVDFHLIKGFDEVYGRPVQEKILSLQPGGQNRDGAAIRHTIYKLRQRNSRTRLLFLISDGRPLDQEYNGAYSQADTRMALHEARSLGIHPFCITVDQMAPEYIRSMYRDLPYIVLSDLRSLPQKLPRIYKRLTV